MSWSFDARSRTRRHASGNVAQVCQIENLGRTHHLRAHGIQFHADHCGQQLRRVFAPLSLESTVPTMPRHLILLVGNAGNRAFQTLFLE